MSVKIRLKRMGRRNRPFYRIVAIDSRTRRDGPEIERLGWFDPLKTDVAVDLKEERIIHWLELGAQPSETVHNILSSTGLQFKMHLMREGKSEEEIASALTEWQLRQEEIRAKQEEKKKAKKKTVAAQAKVVAESTESGDVSEESPAEEAAPEAAAEETVEVEAEAEAAAEEKGAEKSEDVEESKDSSNEKETAQDESNKESSSKNSINPSSKSGGYYERVARRNYQGNSR